MSCRHCLPGQIHTIHKSIPYDACQLLARENGDIREKLLLANDLRKKAERDGVEATRTVPADACPFSDRDYCPEQK